MREIAQEESGNIKVLEIDKLFLKASKDALLRAVRIGYESANDIINNPFFCSVETVLTYMTFKGALDDIPERHVEKCAQSSSFMDIYACRDASLYTHSTPSRKFYLNES